MTSSEALLYALRIGAPPNPSSGRYISACCCFAPGSSADLSACQRSLRPARAPPACRLVRPEKTIIRSLPRLSVCFCCPARRPSPARDHQGDGNNAPANAEHGESGSQFMRPKSAECIDEQVTKTSLQDYLLAFIHARNQLRLHTVRDPELYRNFLFALFGHRVRDFDEALPLPIINNGVLRNDQDTLLLLENDLGIRAHVGFQFAAGISDGYTDFECGDVILFHSKGEIFVTWPSNLRSLNDSTTMRAG